MDYITVGEILKPQGIMGEIKVKPLTQNAERFYKLRVVYIDGKPYKISGLRLERDYAFVKLITVDDRNAAELLRGKFLCIDRINAVDLDDGEYFIVDLIGCKVVTDSGEALGTINDILQNAGAVDVINAVSDDGTEFRFPFLNKIVVNVDVQNKQFTVIKELFDGVCVYDD